MKKKKKQVKVKDVDAMKLAKDVLLLTGGVVVITAAADVLS